MEDIFSRKEEHIDLCLKKDVRSTLSNGFEQYRFLHKALPELDLEKIDLSCRLFGKRMRAPLIIGGITGGTPQAGRLNSHLAEAAELLGLAMVVGSQRISLGKKSEKAEMAASFRIAREKAPSVPLGANLGASQISGIEDCLEAIEMIEADFLVLHLNPLQEALQPEGSPRFSGVLERIKKICESSPVPVVVKEVGCGIDPESARKLYEAGVAAIDVAGVGGTSWARVEGYRGDPILADSFRDWGLPTAESLVRCREALHNEENIFLIASGGVWDGVDAAKAIALGARFAELALPLLSPAARSSFEVEKTLSRVVSGMRIAMFCAGSPDLAALASTPLEKKP
ncbi:MAG TPA: type 2 isopentenyl-diphosphate Delta-isomerase [Cyanobacteria bacterium UBA8530]|nr:type 2 isopentenyl-diphosphate Delta-isomerase [Cyanobacteria bacterium UBA8530]